MLAHNVFFTLLDSSAAARQTLIAACKTYLVDHPGIVFFAVGTPEEGLERPVNVRDFDVALHIVFDSRASHDVYQDAPLHHQFVAENKDGWKQVRVFDSNVSSS
ncbi:MAG: Dabb family protein [Planctomycetia bacterium]|nr:Dabb family protein [Planctomycetia bacterium]